VSHASRPGHAAGQIRRPGSVSAWGAVLVSGRVDFERLAWEDDGPGIRARAEQVAGSRWAVVEYGPGAARDDWCTDGHRGYVIEGALEYEFDDGSEPLALRAGQGFHLAAGTGHRGRNVGDAPARIFLIDDPAS
jgi:quercetin dioxygenase-like cupin family protein